MIVSWFYSIELAQGSHGLGGSVDNVWFAPLIS